MIYDDDIKNAAETLKDGGIILYPSDTIWGLGCDATDEDAVRRIYNLKRRIDSKSMIVLVADEEQIKDYAQMDKLLSEFIKTAVKPTTAVYQKAKNLPSNIIAQDGTIAIRITEDEFCKTLVHLTNKPLVSTSANISGKPYPKKYTDISNEIKDGVDYIVQHRRDDVTPYLPSQIITIKDGHIFYIRS